MTLDLELIRDVVLYRVNNLYIDNLLFDVAIKKTEVIDGHKIYEVVDKVVGKIGHRKPYIIIHYDKILVSDRHIGDHAQLQVSKTSDDMSIDMCDYVSLLRQKKLKDIGV